MRSPESRPSRAEIGGTYERIADHFAETRSFPWDTVVEVTENVGPVDWALDLGCGNGRHVPALERIADAVIGLDLSPSLLALAAADNPAAHWVRGDVVELPVRDRSIDLCLYIATIHHLPTPAERLRSLAEIDRVLAPAGRVLVSAWSVSHRKFDRTRGHDRWVDWTLPDGEHVPRFYHVYDLDEFSATLAKSALEVERVFERGGNCYGLARASDGSEREIARG